MNLFFKGLLVAFVVILLDQWSKYYVFNIFAKSEINVIEVLPFFNLSKVYNYGISFGMLGNIAYGKLILSSVAIVIVLILLFWLYKVRKNYLSVALGMVIGGAIGNIIDRVRVGAVADFLDFHIAGYHWPAFNIADSAVFLGVAVLLIDSFLDKDKV